MKIFRFALIATAMLTASVSNAQYNSGNATVVAQNYDISDNLDLQAVASIFGESRDLEDFERRLNDPSAQISNLDLNNDNYVDYLRVVEVGESDVRVIVIQAVLGQDQFQDVATIEMERQRNRTVQVQIVGNSYLYGPNYIYEPFFYSPPVFFDMFWLPTYRPYFSPWYWGYYPTYFSYWRPMPVFRYHRHIYSHIDRRNRYSYTDNRRLVRADRMASGVRGNSLERQSPNRSFASRNENITNRRALESTRTSRVNSLSNGSNLRSANRSEGIGRSQSFNRSNTNTSRSAVQSGRERVSSEAFSRGRATSSSSRTERVRVQNNNFESGRLNSSSIRREAAPARSRIERSSRISSQPSRTFNQSSSSRSSAPTMRSSSPTMSRSSAPSMSRSSGSMSRSGGGGRSSSGGGMTRGGR
ncbi:hypothetical protein [Paenimyroides aestuarii]|uniref:DUF3300 domain-containing protein n=1 Tax=Paenimyroides aestuarii TaxID=2968490 RepID=A0ABY5NUW3_9FLAO|nr:hypothetical protein [Paenimyroides aestuarii]UUV22247.1 hypothetical protein NPX36_04205 [Paenimyroides aestuarii]